MQQKYTPPKPKKKTYPNFVFNKVVRMKDEELEAWLFRYHKAQGSLDQFYDLYPYKRLPEKEKHRSEERQPERALQPQQPEQPLPGIERPPSGGRAR